jgi:hypothetical protein
MPGKAYIGTSGWNYKSWRCWRTFGVRGLVRALKAATCRRTPYRAVANKRIRQLASGNARKTMKCGRRSLLISTRDRSADICRVFHDGEATRIWANG